MTKTMSIRIELRVPPSTSLPESRSFLYGAAAKNVALAEQPKFSSWQSARERTIIQRLVAKQKNRAK